MFYEFSLFKIPLIYISLKSYLFWNYHLPFFLIISPSFLTPVHSIPLCLRLLFIPILKSSYSRNHVPLRFNPGQLKFLPFSSLTFQRRPPFSAPGSFWPHVTCLVFLFSLHQTLSSQGFQWLRGSEGRPGSSLYGLWGRMKWWYHYPWVCFFHQQLLATNKWFECAARRCWSGITHKLVETKANSFSKPRFLGKEVSLLVV